MAVKYDLSDIEQGSTYRKIFYVKCKNPETQELIKANLSGFTARMKVRQTTSTRKVILDLTTENNGIIIDTVNGIIELYIGASFTSKISNKNTYVYDLELVKEYVNRSEPEVYKLIYGSFALSLAETTW